MRWFKREAVPELPERLATLESWMTTGTGSYVLELERRLIEHELNFIFGYYGVQMSIVPECGLLKSSQVNRCYNFYPEPVADQPSLLVTDPYHWPVQPASLDLVLLHHMLEVSDRPHRVLSEACNSIIPGGKLIVTVFNPFSLCHGASLILPHYRRLFRGVQFITPSRMKDWLTLLGFTVENVHESGYLFPLNRHMKGISAELVEHRCYQWVMPFGSFYIMTATRETPGMIPIKPGWKRIGSHIVHQPIAGSSRVSDESLGENP